VVVAMFAAGAAAALDWLLLQAAFRWMRPRTAKQVAPAMVAAVRR
jgi:hypothetical protein